MTLLVYRHIALLSYSIALPCFFAALPNFCCSTSALLDCSAAAWRRRSVAGLAVREARLQEWVARDMLRAGIVALASPAAASHSAEMLSLLRDILLQYLTTSLHPRQVPPRCCS